MLTNVQLKMKDLNTIEVRQGQDSWAHLIKGRSAEAIAKAALHVHAGKS